MNNAELDGPVPIAGPVVQGLVQAFAILVVAHGPGPRIGTFEAQFPADDVDKPRRAPRAPAPKVDFRDRRARGAQREAQPVRALHGRVARLGDPADILAQSVQRMQSALVQFCDEGDPETPPTAVCSLHSGDMGSCAPVVHAVGQRLDHLGRVLRMDGREHVIQGLDRLGLPVRHVAGQHGQAPGDRIKRPAPDPGREGQKVAGDLMLK